VTPEKIVPLLRDLATLGVGAYTFHWSVTHGANLGAMLTSAAVMLGPTGIALLASWFGTPASQPSPHSAPQAPSAPLRSPSPPAAGEP
jgi:hypothetical protein